MTMLARMLVGILVAGAALGCKGQLNAAYCAEHPDDSDCRDTGLVRIDAPAPRCTTDPDCAGDPDGTVCDTSRGTCVECIEGVADSACTASMMVCGVDQKCHGCIVDSDCTSSSMVCLPSQSCAMEAAVVYAKPDSANPTGTACTKDAPCSFATAVAQLTMTRHILKLTTMAGFDYEGPPVTFNQPFGVQLIGTATTFTPTAAGDAIVAAGQNLEILALTVTGAQGNGIACTAGRLTLRCVNVTGSTGWGLETGGCNAEVERSRFSSNTLGGMSLTAGDMEIRNNILDRNGSSALEEGNVMIRNAGGRFVFNTIALNLSRSGGGRTSGITCVPGAGGFRISRNILAGNGPANDELTGTCGAVGNYITETAADVNFLSTSDFRLTAMSPDAVIDDPDAAVDCQLNGEDIDDYQGESRRFLICDKGSDELVPLTQASLGAAPR